MRATSRRRRQGRREREGSRQGVEIISRTETARPTAGRENRDEKFLRAMSIYGAQRSLTATQRLFLRCRPRPRFQEEPAGSARRGPAKLATDRSAWKADSRSEHRQPTTRSPTPASYGGARSRLNLSNAATCRVYISGKMPCLLFRQEAAFTCYARSSRAARTGRPHMCHARPSSLR